MTGPELAAAAGITYRQVDHWTRRGHLMPLAAHPGVGNQRDYGRPEVFVAVAIRRLTRAGVVLPVAARIARGDRIVLHHLLDTIGAVAGPIQRHRNGPGMTFHGPIGGDPVSRTGEGGPDAAAAI